MDLYRSAAAFLVLAALMLAGHASAGGLLRDFTSDGCSLFPDAGPGERSRWCDCCFLHDIAYWKGGNAEDRLQADEALRACVRERTGNAVLANVMFEGVRMGGHPVFPNWYRWGYGWDYGRGYAQLTEQELRATRDKLERYFKGHPLGYCAPHGN
jgi:hypothetical protein